MKTQKPFLIIVGILLACTTGQAQFIKSVGLKGGVAISNIRVTDVTSIVVGGNSYVPDFIHDNVASPTVSLFADFLREDHLGLQAEFTYLQKGASHSYELPVTTIDHPNGTGELHELTDEYRLHYLMFTVAAQPKLPLGDVALYAHVGPTASYLLDVSNFLWVDEFNRFQLGYTLGLGAEVAHLFNGTVFLEVRYAGDFSPFYEPTYAKLWNRSWMFSLGTSF